MEEKNYEAGRVEISSTEYRDLVTEAVTARSELSHERSRRWEIEETLRKTKEELELTKKKVCELKNISEAYIRTSPTPVYHDYAALHSKLFDMDGNLANAKEGS